ncbi:hypothetical protein M1555_05485 [Patescibacteria group bacterium]|nr:hypothetical protein [Patescibacteria group bacterium]
MIDQADIARAKELLDKATEVLILTHEHPSPDSIGSALSLALGLIGLGKKVTVVCPSPVTVELSNFVGADKVVTQLGKKNFIISLDYVDGSIEKVSYNIEGAKFNLVIEPRPGFELFSPDKVHYSYGGNSAQVICTVDTVHLGGLGKLYEDNKDIFASRPIINIDRHGNNAGYGQVNVLDVGASATAEGMAHLLSGIGVKLTTDIATNLLNAVYGATNNFVTQNVSAGAFEVAAVCIKAGGKRFSDMKEPVSPAVPPQPIPPAEPEVKPSEKPPVKSAGEKGQGKQPHYQAPYQPQSTVQPPKADVSPVPQKSPGAPPEDWLKPKIFKSSTPS